MPNRKERRIQASRARARALYERGEKAGRCVIPMAMTPKAKAELLAVTQMPGYHELLDALLAAAVEWRKLYPEVVLTFRDTRNVLLTGDLKDDFNKGYLATSPGAVDLLTFMDERTGQKASLLQVQFVLKHLEWIER